MAEKKSELIVIGAGPGGYPAAFLAADLGLDVTLIDPEINPGGVCLYRGCIPTKTLLHCTTVMEEARNLEQAGITFPRPKIDLDALRQNKEQVVARLTGGLGTLAKQRKINYIRGKARFINPGKIEVLRTDGESLELDFTHSIIASGSRPAAIPSLDISSRLVMDSNEALQMRDIPTTLLVVGGGYIGLEMGMIYASLGSRVTVVEMMPSVLPGADPDLVRIFSRSAAGKFEAILTGTRVTGAEEKGDGITVKLEDQKGEIRESVFAKVLVTVGRRPNSEDLGLKAAGVRTDEKGFITVNEFLHTDNEHIFAIGDVVGGAMLAHKATAEAKVAVRNILGRKTAFAPAAIPAVLFTDPEVTWCGLTETEAKEKGIKVRTARFMWGASGRALSLGRTDGFTKLIVDETSDKILGVGIVGFGAGELIAEGALAVEKGITAEELANVIHPHPTLSETVMEAAEAVHGVSTHMYQPRRG